MLGAQRCSREAPVIEGTRRARVRERLRLGIAAGRVVRVSLVTAFVVFALVGGAAALWLSADPVRPQRTASKVDPPTPEPAIRLDTLPAPRSFERRKESRASAKAAPVIGVGTEEFSGEGGDADEGGRADDAIVEVDGKKPTEEIATDAEIESQLAALERANARIEAARAGVEGSPLPSGSAGAACTRASTSPSRSGRTCTPPTPAGWRSAGRAGGTATTSAFSTPAA
jgi:hypothetical protein